MFKRVLIANRGEIAIRIAKAAAALGIESVGVYASVDAQSLHARFTTDARPLPGDPVRAYLDVDAIVSIAVDTGCDCVHPGYGFLSENARFAQRCADAGVTFVGPSPDALALFGDKVRARALAQSLGVPVVSGSEGALASVADAAATARAIGYPVMLKASAGGGGRGMRAVANETEIEAAFERCRS
ncbi:MAG TPA: biotin carboxylase N-terminal domain-containing protein, partial [Pseudomonadales bacterium]|nr:biotin carboxylase N-terminal domain-containing protein [Pseudomonadales bacterium]